jgi:hypothetical protein
MGRLRGIIADGMRYGGCRCFLTFTYKKLPSAVSIQSIPVVEFIEL